VETGDLGDIDYRHEVYIKPGERGSFPRAAVRLTDLRDGVKSESGTLLVGTERAYRSRGRRPRATRTRTSWSSCWPASQGPSRADARHNGDPRQCTHIACSPPTRTSRWATGGRSARRRWPPARGRARQRLAAFPPHGWMTCRAGGWNRARSQRAADLPPQRWKGCRACGRATSDPAPPARGSNGPNEKREEPDLIRSVIGKGSASLVKNESVQLV
jgi:hypothetical protein